MNKPQGLVMPKNPALALQELHRKQMSEPVGDTAEDTARSTAVSTPVRKARSTGVQKETSTEGRTDAQTAVREEGRTAFRDKITSQTVREPTVRVTIDVPESLHSRLKEYCLDHKVASLRVLTLALYEEFLQGEDA